MDITNSKAQLFVQANVINNLNLEPTLTSLNTKSVVNPNAVKEIPFHELSQVAEELGTEKPRLRETDKAFDATELSDALNLLGTAEKTALLNDIRQFMAITPEHMQQAVTKVLTEEKSAIEQVFQTAQLPDDMEIKQISQAIQVMVASSFFKDTLDNQTGIESKVNETKSADEVKSNQFIGIVSSDIIMELAKIIRKVLAEINISDRRVSADFLMLNAKMVEAAAESTIREGKEMFIGALAGFCTSLAISTAGSMVQLKSLHTQNQSIKNNLVKANQNGAVADRLADLSKNNSALAKSNSINLKGKEGNSIEMVDSATSAQKSLVKQRAAESAQRTNKLGLAEGQEHERIMNKTRTQSSIAEQGSRLSDNAGQMATSANQINVKEEEANKMQQQSVADIARTVSSDKDKQIDKDKDLVKQMNEHLREIREGQLRTFQSVVRG